MSDLSDLEGVYPSSLRFNAEDGFLAVSGYSGETGERELKPIEFGADATFVMDMATRERGYGLIRVGVYDMRLTPVGSLPPPPPDDPDFKPAVGCWLWCPSLGELRLETNSAYFRQAISNIWDKARLAPEAAAGLQPVISFVDRLSIWNKKYNKTFFMPKIEIIGWVEREKIYEWSARTPTVSLPSPSPLLPVAAATSSSRSEPAATKPAKVTPAAVKGGGSLSELLDDDLPDSLK
jgi:hypothetical protein